MNEAAVEMRQMRPLGRAYGIELDSKGSKQRKSLALSFIPCEAVPVRGKWRACAERGSFLPAMQALAFPGSKVLPFTPKRVHFPILSTNIISRSTNQKGALTKMIALFVKAPFVWVYSIRGLSNKIKT